MRFEDMKEASAAHWENAEQVHVAQFHAVRESDKPNARVIENQIRLWRLNARTGEKTLLKQYSYSPEVSPMILREAGYALIDSAATGSAPEDTTGLIVLNLDTGSRIVLPGKPSQTFASDYGWSGDQRKIAYATFPNLATKKRQLVLADADQGIVASVDIPQDYECTGYRLSPDCRYVAFFSYPTHGVIWRGFARVEIWDTRTGAITPVRVLGGVGSILSIFCCFDFPFALPRWSPDGRYLAFEACHFHGSQTAVAIEAADWGGWVARRE